MEALGTILTAMVTPFDAQLRVDEEGAATLARRLAETGSDGLVVCGTTGEAPTLSDEEHLRMIEVVVEAVSGLDCTVVAGTGSNDTRHACHMTARATELGVDGVLSVTPYYNRPNRRGIVRHFEEVARATDKPVILYNIPSRTGTDMPNGLLAELAQIEHVDAVKQARYEDIELVDGLALYAGDDPLLAKVLDMGGAGGICVASHLFGSEMHAMVSDTHRRRQIDGALQDVYSALSVTTNPIPIKAALGLVGLPSGGLRLPLVEADAEEMAAIRGMLAAHGLLEGAPA